MSFYEYKVADVFTDKPLSGNPVAVFLDATGLSSEDMQKIAKEMQLSETVFVLPKQHEGDVWVRIFTPVNELPFAGHPTLGTAIVLGETMDLSSIIMETAMGLVPFELTRDSKGRATHATMKQPIPSWEEYSEADLLLAGLGIKYSTVPIDVYCNGPRHVFVGLESIEELASLNPDHRILATLPDVAVNCFAGSGSHWRNRMFSPAYGVVEDAATGSAAGPLAIHISRNGLVEFGTEIEILQGVEIERPSHMYAVVRVDQENTIISVDVSGASVIVSRGFMEL